jgi:hypothetical protein
MLSAQHELLEIAPITPSVQTDHPFGGWCSFDCAA